MKKQKIIIIGGDKVSYYLISLLTREEKYDIRVIEMRMNVGEKVANSFPVQVFHGNGTKTSVLKRAGADENTILIALTGKDEDNLVACQLAKQNFACYMTIARVNNPNNINLMEMLGVDKVFSSTQMIATLIDQELSFSGMSIAYNIPGNTKAIISVPLNPLSNACGKRLTEYEFVGDSRVVLVTRPNGETLIPTGELRMQAGDNLLMVSDQKYFEDIWHEFIRPDDKR